MPFSTLGKIHRDIDKVKLILKKKDKIFFNKYHHLFEQLKQSRQRFIDTINLKMEDGSSRSIKLFLVQHNLAFGPGHGVLQFIKEIHLPRGVLKTSHYKLKDKVENWILEEVEATATTMSLYHALHNLKLGGACCAVALLELKMVDDQIKMAPINLNDIEEALLAREIGQRLVKYHIMGPESLWLEPDNLTTNEQILNWVEDEALKTLLRRQLLSPRDKELFDTLNKIHRHSREIINVSESFDNHRRILETPYHDEALLWLKDWRATRRGEIAIEELLSKTSKVGKQYRRQILRISLKYWGFPSLAKNILSVQRLLTVMNLPFKDLRPNGQIVILDTGIAPAIVEKHIEKLSELSDEDVVVMSVLAKRLGGSSPEMIVQLCRIYVEAAYNLGAKVVLLCNTMDANAREILSKEFTIPVLGPIKPAIQAVKRYLETTYLDTQNIGILATKATIAAGTYENEASDSVSTAKIYNVIAPLLATLVDTIATGKSGSEISDPRNVAILEENLLPLIEKDIDILILGCTHYGIFEQMIHDYWIRCTGKDVFIVNSSKELPNFTATYLKENRIVSTRSDTHNGARSHMASQEDAVGFQQGVLKISGRDVDVIPIDIGEVVGRLSEEDRSFQETVFKESSEDVHIRTFIINSDLSARAKVAIADTLYGTGNMNLKNSGREILPIELTDELMIELVLLSIRDNDMLRILSSVMGTPLEIIELQNSKGMSNIVVKSNTQNYFLVGENNQLIRVLHPQEKEFFTGLLFFKMAASKYIHVEKLDVSFFFRTSFKPHQLRELDKFNEALKEIKKIKQNMVWNCEHPKHSKESSLKVKHYLDKIGFHCVELETKIYENIIHTYVIIHILDTEMIVDISASQFELTKGTEGLSFMRELGVVVIPRSEVEKFQKSDPKSLLFYHNKHP